MLLGDKKSARPLGPCEDGSGCDGIEGALDEAFRRAWPSIRDGNVTTLIGTAVLYGLTTGSIRGFALTLTIGILVSLFTAMAATRVMLRTVSRFRRMRGPWFFLGAPKV